MKTCKYCGMEVSDTAKKCKYCGEWIINQESNISSNKSIIENKTIKSETNNKEINIPINSGKNTIKQQKFIIICVSCVVAIIIALVVGFLFQNIVDNPKGNGIEKILKTATSKEFIYENGEEVAEYTIPNFHDLYNKIVLLKDKQTGSDIYAIRREIVDSSVPNTNGDYIALKYEIARIMLNSKDKKHSKCSYDYNYDCRNTATPQDNGNFWFNCNENEFMKNLPQIAKLKKEESLNLEKASSDLYTYDFCFNNQDGNGDYDSSDSEECRQILKKKTIYTDYYNYLEKLRKTTL